MKVKIIKEEKNREVTYRALKSDRGLYGVEAEHSTIRVSMEDIFKTEGEALTMLEIISKQEVFPKQLEETMWDYVTQKALR